VMVSRQETARPLLTPGEVMQLPPDDALVLVSGLAPIRAKKLRYYEDRNFTGRVVAPPKLVGGPYGDRPPPRGDDWGGQVRGPHAGLAAEAEDGLDAESEGGLQQQRHPGLAEEETARPVADDGEVGLGLVDDDPDAVADRQAMARAQPAGQTIARAHAINEGAGHDAHRGDDLLPSF
ncbi:MAG: type IV secretory system conjugative DNA transfer family protein, partial [Caulobacter sp.]